MTTMAEMIEAYRLTWDPALVELIDRFRVAILEQPAGDPQYPSWDYHPMLCAWDYVFSGDPAMLNAFKTLVAQHPTGSGNGIGPGGVMQLAALFSLIERKPSLMEPWLGQLYSDSVSVVDRPGEDAHNLVTHMWYGYIYSGHKYPFALKAIKQFGLSLQRPTQTQPAPLPVTAKRTRVVVKEAVDQQTPVTLSWRAKPEGDIRVCVFDADGKQVAEAVRPAASKGDARLEVSIPLDGKVSEYAIDIIRSQEYDQILWPLTSLDHEVVMMPVQKELIIGTAAEGICLFVLPPFTGTATIGLTTRNSSATAVEMLADDGSSGVRASATKVSSGTTLAAPVRSAAASQIYASGEARLKLPANGTGDHADAPWWGSLRPRSLFRPAVDWSKVEGANITQ